MFHTIILRDSETICFESRNIIIFLDQTGYLTNLSVTIAIDQAKSLYFIVHPLCCELPERVDGFEVRSRDASVGVDMEQIDDRD